MKIKFKKYLPNFFFKAYHFWWALFSSFKFGLPSKNIKIIGITGTKGKSSVIEITNKILETAGIKTAISSSLRFKIGSKEKENKLKMTMPGKGFLQEFLAEALKNNCQIAILETTSEGIVQFRHKYINFDLKVFLNLQPEHLERHGGFENYKKAKGRLFKNSRDAIHILNLDDENVGYFLGFPARKKIGFSFDRNNKFKLKVDDFIFLEEKTFLKDKTIFKVNVFKQKIYSNLIGEFNLYNILASISIALALGLEESVVKEAIESFKKIKGRFEVFEKDDYKVILDYAHTPDSLEAVLKTIKNVLNPNYLVCLSGAAGGGRDKWKRPEMGKKLNLYCDKIILANEDPYDEDPLVILKDIKGGIENKEKVLTILDRKEAIKKGIDIVKSKKNSIFAVFGKGSENLMVLRGGEKIPWSDKKIIKNLL